eukprot:CAMPEP_0118851136 /NCGR_PEP_ID=MMETSP1163-20130328/691_1 /TAXON_ID=124430 /ORGANISM="Phaeomonas parva, Strain CCMP2877" /LENGTH=465 /DNA_ID=CAMNT_0006783421 /DNA_START=139 /DNA_END=1536 /DNA_ORIENTATION=-
MARLGLLALLPALAAGLIHEPEFDRDARGIFAIETFGFLAGGVMEFEVSKFEVEAAKPETSYDCMRAANTARLPDRRSCAYKVGLLMMRTSSKSASEQRVQEAAEEGTCLLDAAADDDVLIDLSDEETWSTPDVMNFEHTVPKGKEGFYSLVFNRCAPDGQHAVSFTLKAVFRNPGPDYLSAGDGPLPTVYYCFAAAFAAALGVWMMVLRRSAPRTVVHIHKLMAVLVMFKVMTLLFDGVRYQVIGHTGHADGWTVVFYIFTVLRSISLFVVILLIGMGWSLLKPSLNEREKKIIFFVLTLQVLDNIAFLVVDETAPGSQSYLQWRDVLHLVDIICCCAILFPIVWSIRHLRQGAGTDGKMAANLNRLETFRYFYIMVISYIYFTRIVVYLTAAVIPFQLSWLKVFLEEAATLLFYVLTGVKFRPAEDNPYVKLSQEDDDDTEEFGLDDEGVELLEQPKTVLTKV